MRKLIGLAAAAAFLMGVGSSGVMAMPLTPGADLSGPSVVTRIVDGCGPFGHRSHFGYCKPNGYGGPGPGFDGPPRIFGGPVYRGGGYGPRCFVRETYYGPRRVCRY